MPGAAWPPAAAPAAAAAPPVTTAPAADAAAAAAAAAAASGGPARREHARPGPQPWAPRCRAPGPQNHLGRRCPPLPGWQTRRRARRPRCLGLGCGSSGLGGTSEQSAPRHRCVAQGARAEACPRRAACRPGQSLTLLPALLGRGRRPPQSGAFQQLACGERRGAWVGRSSN
jgi:hypothetical protein